MANYNALEALINAYIKQNGVKAITGQVLNGVLRGMVSALGKGWTIAEGDARPDTDPGTMTGPVAYVAHTAGTYIHFGGLVVNEGEVALLKYNEQTWTKEVLASLAANATIDGNVGTPAVGVSFVNGVLTFDFRNMKGNPGDSAGFGTVNATVDGTIGTPGVTVQASGPDTAKNFTFAFTGLKGETGVTSVVASVDNTTGNPSCSVSLVGQELHLDFTGLKGAQGDTGVSADYPIAIVNNLTTNDPASALSAAQGVVLDGKVSQLEAKVDEIGEGMDVITDYNAESLYRIGYKKQNTESVAHLNDKLIDGLFLAKGVAYTFECTIPSALTDKVLTKICDIDGNLVTNFLTIAIGSTSASYTYTPSNDIPVASVQLRNNITTFITTKVTAASEIDGMIDKCMQFDSNIIVLSSNLTDFDLTTIRAPRMVTLEAPEGYVFSQLPSYENEGTRAYGLRRWTLSVFPFKYLNISVPTNLANVYILVRVGAPGSVSAFSSKRIYIGYTNFSDHTINWSRIRSDNTELHYFDTAIVQGDSIANLMMGQIDNALRMYCGYNLSNVAIAGSSIAHGGGTSPNLWKSLVDRSKSDNADYIDVSSAKRLIIWMGVNDKVHNVAFGDDGTTDETTIEGAMRVAVNNFLTANPLLSICFVTPNNNPYYNGENRIGHTLEDYADEIVSVCKKLNVQSFDLYHCSCITDANKASVFNRSGDQMHPSNDWLLNVAANYIMGLLK